MGNKGLSEKMDDDEKEKIMDALKDDQSWLDSNPEADAEGIKEKHKEVEGICAPIVSKYYGAGGGAGGEGAGEEHIRLCRLAYPETVEMSPKTCQHRVVTVAAK